MRRAGFGGVPVAVVLALAVAGAAAAGSFSRHDVVHPVPARDASPPGRRTPVILIHGWGFGNTLTFAGLRGLLLEEVHRAATDEDPATDPWALEVFEYSYDYAQPYHVLARELVRDVEGLLGANDDPGARRPVLVAVSAGGVLARYALEEPGFGARVAGVIPIASPLHGCLGATMLFANERAREDLGEDAWETIERTREDMEFSRYRDVLASLGFDNLGPPGPGGEPRDLLPAGLLERWGLTHHVNHRLRRVNQAGHWDHKFFPHMGTNRIFETWRDPILGERQRGVQARILGRYAAVSPRFVRDADPIIPLYSGALAFPRRGGRPVDPARALGAPAQLYEGMTHTGTVLRRSMHLRVLDQIRTLGHHPPGPSSMATGSEAPSFEELFGVPRP